MSLALDVGVSSVRAVMEVAESALRMPATRFTSEFQRGLQLQRLLYRHAQAKLNQARQIAACIGAHHFEQRLAGWLLMISDRARSPELFLTHEHLAATLNVRRESVTSACTSLRSRGLIRYNRGRILILDRKGLASEACRCYHPINVADLA